MTDVSQPTPQPIPTADATASTPAQPPEQQATKQKKSLVPLYVVIGVTLVGVIIGLLFYVTKINTKTPPNEQVVAPAQEPLFLTITSPTQSTAAINGEVIVSGQTLPDTTIAIYSDIDETIVDSDTQGNFEGTVVVDEQGGLIRIVAFSAAGEEETQTIDLSQNSDLSLGNTVNVLGESTSKKENKDNVNSQKSQGNKDKQDNSTGNTTKSTPKQNKQDSSSQASTAEKDKQIRDFVSNKSATKKLSKIGGMKLKELLKEGTESGKINKQLKIERLVAKQASNGASIKRHAVSGIITSVTGTVITIVHQIQQERVFYIYYNAGTLIKSKGTTSEDATDSAELSTNTALTVGMRITAVGTPIDDGLLATRIHVIPGKAKGVFNKQPVSSPSGILSLTPSPTASATATPTASISLTPTETVTPTP